MSQAINQPEASDRLYVGLVYRFEQQTHAYWHVRTCDLKNIEFSLKDMLWKWWQNNQQGFLKLYRFCSISLKTNSKPQHSFRYKNCNTILQFYVYVLQCMRVQYLIRQPFCDGASTHARYTVLSI
jgi:hypothetical protein